MGVVEWVLGGQVQQEIVGLITQAGGVAVGLTGRDGGLIRAQKLKMLDNVDPRIEHDVGQVGDIVSVNTAIIKAYKTILFPLSALSASENITKATTSMRTLSLPPLRRLLMLNGS